MTYELGTKGSLTTPKFKELKDGTKLLCIVRSSNAAQPINYIQAEWKREGNRYYITQADGKYPFEFAAGQDLGTLYMMVVAGGEWDAAAKKLKLSLTSLTGRSWLSMIIRLLPSRSSSRTMKRVRAKTLSSPYAPRGCFCVCV